MNNPNMREFMTDNMQYKLPNGNWTRFPGMLKITIDDVTATDKIGPNPAGNSYKMLGERDVQFGINIIESDVDSLELVDTLRGYHMEIYFDTGELNGNYIELYAKDVISIPSLKLQIPDKPIKYDIVLGVEPNSALVSLNPSTALPAAAHSHGTNATVTGKNVYYAWVKTAIV